MSERRHEDSQEVSVSGPRILIADDHQETLEHLGQMLGEWGYEVIAADNPSTTWVSLS